MYSIRKIFIHLSVILLLAGCDSGEPLTTERYQEPDSLFSQLEANINAAAALEKLVEIDHSRLGSEAGSEMPPARVLIFSNPRLETELIKQNPLVAIDLPVRVLAFESEPGGDSKVIYNSIDYIESRYQLAPSPVLRELFDESMTQVLQGIGPEKIASFNQDTMEPDGITTISSPYDFQTTFEQVQAAIGSQDDTVGFGSIDFQQRARTTGEEIAPSILILFGGPAPGAQAMSKAPTLGLDAFCQKFLVWQDEKEQVYLSFNDLLALAERQDVGKSVALRVINYRLNKVFTDALENQD
jgi:uncharacterized protein (DUF302 family)